MPEIINFSTKSKWGRSGHKRTKWNKNRDVSENTGLTKDITSFP